MATYIYWISSKGTNVITHKKTSNYYYRTKTTYITIKQ